MSKHHWRYSTSCMPIRPAMSHGRLPITSTISPNRTPTSPWIGSTFGATTRGKPEKELDWITAHALRGLIKAGHPRAMAMLGYDPKAKVHVTLTLPDQARINDVLELNVQINAAPGTPVLVDYAIDFLRPSGKVGRKVFKLKQAKVANADLSLTKRHRLKGGASTFTLVPGSHRVQVMVNGRVRAEGVFDLRAETSESR